MMWTNIYWILLTATRCLGSPVQVTRLWEATGSHNPVGALEIAPRVPVTDQNSSWSRDGAHKGYLRMPMSRKVFNGTGKRRGRDRGKNDHSCQAVRKRGWGWQHVEDVGGIIYTIQLDIGSPPQSVQVLLDTGSYELWVNPNCSGSIDQALCKSYGTYYPRQSRSATLVGGSFDIAYGTGGVQGQYWSDKMAIAMFQMSAVQFGVASNSNFAFSGVLGLGYTFPHTIPYPSVLNLMVSQKMISAPLFSLGLGGEADGFSEIIFGGVNRWKFSGKLEPVPIWPPISKQDPSWLQYWVNVTSVGLSKPNANPVTYTDARTFTMPMLLDTGSTLSYFREDLVAKLGKEFNAVISADGLYTVDCKYRNMDGSVDFGFNRGRMTINVPYKDFIYEQSANRCLLGAQAADVGSTNYVLGDTFIRGAYLVFDQQSDIVWMNQYFNCGDGVVSVGLKPKDAGLVAGAC